MAASSHQEIAEVQDTLPIPISPLLTGNDYHGHRIGPIVIPAYHSPLAQILLVGVVCFLCPGMLNALNGMGGGGQVDPTVADNAASALYATFAVVAFCSGSICNYLGVRLSFIIGSFGYVVYSASFLTYNHTRNDAFVVFAGAITGFSAGCLWCAQGVVIMSYPSEQYKGRAIAIFWAIFNVGAVIGAIVPLAENFHSEKNSVTDGTYIAFVVLMFVGFILAFFLLPAEKVVRSDGSRVHNIVHPGIVKDIKGLWACMIEDPWILMLFPLFFSSNWFYTYQFNDYNAALFTIRARALNNLLYWLMQIIAAASIGRALDTTRFSRKIRAYGGWSFVFILCNIIWAGGLAVVLNQMKYGLETRIDIYDSCYFAHLFLYMWYGFLDAVYQVFIYWLMGALTNDGRKLAYYAGYYKGIQSAGAAIVWRIDAIGRYYQLLFASSWGFMVLGLVLCLPVLILRVHITEEEASSEQDNDNIKKSVIEP